MSHEQSPNAKWKDADSPAGHEFYAPRSCADLPDCPICGYGTPVLQEGGKWKCEDCGHWLENFKPTKRR